MKPEFYTLFSPGTLIKWHHPLLHRDIVGIILSAPYQHPPIPSFAGAWFCSVLAEGEKIIKELTPSIKIIKRTVPADKKRN